MSNPIIEKLKEKGYYAELTQTSKNGIEQSGIIIGKNHIRGVIYPDMSLSLDDCVEDIIRTYERTKIPDIDHEIFTWDFAKDNVYLCLQHITNENLLKRNFLDLEMYVRVMVDNDFSYKVNPKMFGGVSHAEIFLTAEANSKKALKIMNMKKMLTELMHCDEDMLPDCENGNMLVLSNTLGMYGASSICNITMLNDLATKYDSNLVIIPSSIHECIVYTDNDPDLKKYAEMITDINMNVVNPKEVLNNHAYFYNKETKKITW